MPIKSNSPAIRFASATISLIIISIVLSIVWHVFVQNVLMMSPSLPPEVRHGYDNPYLSLLALTAGFLFVSYILNGIIQMMLSKITSSIVPKLILGMLTGLLPVVILQLTTFGLPFSDPAMLTQLSILAIGGGLLPITQDVIGRYLMRKKP